MSAKRPTRHNPSPASKAERHAVLWSSTSQMRGVTGPMSRLELATATAAVVLVLLHEEELEEEAATRGFEGGGNARPLVKLEQLRRETPVAHWPQLLYQRTAEALDAFSDQWHGPIEPQHLFRPESARTALEMHERLNLHDYGRERPEFLIEAPLQAVEAEHRHAAVDMTPKALARLIAELVEPKPGESIYNPGSGTGTLLRAAWKHMEPKLRRLPPREYHSIVRNTFSGLEHNERNAFISLVRLKLAGLIGPRIHVRSLLDEDTLAHPKNGYDVILCDPPWGGRFSREEDSRHAGEPYLARSSEGRFLEHILRRLAPGGRAAIVVPPRLLFATGGEARLRERMLEEFRLEAVVDLPAKVMRNTLASSLLLISRISPRRSVTFVDAAASSHFVLPPGEPGWQGVEARHLRQAIAETPTESQVDREAGALLEAHILRVPMPDIQRHKGVLDSRRYARSEEEAFLWAVRSKLPSVPILPLEEVADVFRGRPQWNRHRVEKTDGNQIALIRISDVSKAERDPEGLPVVTKIHHAIEEDFEDNIGPEHWLHPRDILITMDGTVGKLAFAGQSTSRALPGQGIAVIRAGDKVLPGYLLALLRTAPYTEMLKSRVAGSVISHLRLSDLRELTVPLLPMEQQRRVAAAAEFQSAAGLMTMLGSGETLSFWERMLMDSPSVSQLIHGSDNLLPALKRLANEELPRHAVELQSLRKSDWAPASDFVILAERAQRLDQVLEMPDSPDKAMVLQVWRQDNSPLKSALLAGAEGPHRPVAARLVGFSEALKQVAAGEWERLLGETTIKIDVTDGNILADDIAQCIIHVENATAFPIVAFHMEISGTASRYDFPILSAGGSLACEHLVSERFGRDITLLIRWQAKRVDMTPLSGQVEWPLPFRARPSGPASAAPIKKVVDFGSNPYVTGISIGANNPEQFFGRKDLITQIRSLLRLDGPSSVLILEGVRRVGKTSLLKQLQREKTLPGWLPVYYDFQSADGSGTTYGVPASGIFYGLLEAAILTCRERKIAVSVGGLNSAHFPSRPVLRNAVRKAFSENYRNAEAPYALFVEHMEELVAATAPLHVLFMLDEFDKTKAGIDNGITSPQIAENFRNLFHNFPQVSGILTGSQLMKRMRGEYFNPLFGIGRSLPIGELDRPSALELIATPPKGRLTFATEAMEYLVDVSACQPFILQHLCSRIFDLCLQRRDPSVTLELAKQASRDFREQQSHFRQVWDEDVHEAPHQLVTALINELEAGRLETTAEVIRGSLRSHGISPTGRLVEILESLADLQVIRRERVQKRQTYHIATPLFAEWLVETIDVFEYAGRVVSDFDAAI